MISDILISGIQREGDPRRFLIDVNAAKLLDDLNSKGSIDWNWTTHGYSRFKGYIFLTSSLFFLLFVVGYQYLLPGKPV